MTADVEAGPGRGGGRRRWHEESFGRRARGSDQAKRRDRNHRECNFHDGPLGRSNADLRLLYNFGIIKNMYLLCHTITTAADTVLTSRKVGC
jgi:hypothetical protein